MKCAHADRLGPCCSQAVHDGRDINWLVHDAKSLLTNKKAGMVLDSNLCPMPSLRSDPHQDRFTVLAVALLPAAPTQVHVDVDIDVNVKVKETAASFQISICVHDFLLSQLGFCRYFVVG